MANASAVQITLTATPTNGQAVTLAKSYVGAPSAAFLIQGSEAILTTATTLAPGSLTGAGKLLFINLDAVNFVQIDSANTFDKFPQKVGPGEAVLLSPQTTTLYAKADTATCQCQYLWLNS